MDLAGKTILITGGARRIGAAIAFRLAVCGGVVLLHFNNSREEAARTIAGLPGSGHRLVGPVDFSAPDASELLAGLVGQCDILINNASLYRARGDDPKELERRYFQVNCRVPTQLMQWLAAGRRGGAIVNLLDQVVLRECVPDDPYTRSRRALFAETLRAAREFAAVGVRVNAVAPGPVLPPVGLEGSRMEKELRSVPLGRPVAVNDLVDAVEFLIVNDSVTGAVLPVDCGQHLTG